MPILHRNITNATDIHNPKWLSTANNGDYAWKNEKGELESTDEIVLPAALNFVDASVAPPTSNNGDIYILSSGGSVNAGWGSVAVGDWVRYDGSLWNSITPQKSSLCYDKSADSLKFYNGLVWAGMGGGISSVTSAEKAALSPSTGDFVFDTDLNSLQRYDGAAWVSVGGYAKATIRNSNGSLTNYSNFYDAYNNSVADDIIEIYASHTVDCGLGTAQWIWTKNITVNLNGHNLIITGTKGIRLNDGLDVQMTNGIFELQSTSINSGAFTFQGNGSFTGDGAITVFCQIGGSVRSSFYSIGNSTKSCNISGVIGKGSYSSFIVTGVGTVNIFDCVIYNPTNGDETFNGDNIKVNRCTIYAKLFSVSGSYTMASRDTVRTFNNCFISTDGSNAIGTRSAIFNNCSIITNDDEVKTGIGGEQEFNNCKLERTGTVGHAYGLTNASSARFYNTQIISTGGCIYTNMPMEFYHCYLKADGGDAILQISGLTNTNLIVENTYIEATSGSCILYSGANQLLGATINNSTLICNTSNKFCLTASTNTFFKFLNNTFKNTANSSNIYGRSGLITENPQTSTPDSFGNIVMD